MDLSELNRWWENYSVEVLYYEKKIEEYKTVLNVLNEEMAFLRGGAAKEGYVYNEKLGRWVNK
ncbi:hypothetical protein DU52_15600 [Methanosarcina mazei]|uniref:Uncharacterized protein n=1 Tax=Methanosarcina mazei TaxID=2209 RepID=A0A0F8G881_METMZ|nr:hypothetical protein [Methanosarcina mazei]KKG35363.1 hypothetical protein DU52_15600 [Methanosarcina mazei]